MPPPRTGSFQTQCSRRCRRALHNAAHPWGRRPPQDGRSRFEPGTGGVRGEAGFTLMEILVAVAVLAICLVTIMQLFAGGLRSSRIATDYNRAVFHAREKMEEILAVDQLGEGVEEGEFSDGFRWWAETVLVIPEEESNPDEMMPFMELPFDIMYVRVVVFWGEGANERQFELETAKPIELVSLPEEG